MLYQKTNNENLSFCHSERSEESETPIVKMDSLARSHPDKVDVRSGLRMITISAFHCKLFCAPLSNNFPMKNIHRPTRG